MWLKRDKIIEIRRFGSSNDFVNKRKYRVLKFLASAKIGGKELYGRI